MNIKTNQSRRDSELLIIEKMYDLQIWSLKHIEKFPRNHRYGLGLRLEERLSRVLDLLLRAKYSRDRLPRAVAGACLLMPCSTITSTFS